MSGSPPFTLESSKKCLHLVQGLRRARLPTPPLNTFYRGIIKAFSQTASLPGSGAAEEQQQLNSTVKRASRITDAPLPYLMERYRQHCIRSPPGIS